MKCVAFSGDNMNTNFGVINRSGSKNVFHALKHELKKELVSVGCPAHILHNCICVHKHIVCGHRMHHNEDLQLFLHIHSKNRKSRELL
jgi:hypothetical protein